MKKSNGLPFPDNFMAIFGFYRVPGSERYEEMEQVVEEENGGSTMTRFEVLKIVEDARKKGIRADLTRADLARAKLTCADLTDADLRYANMSGADLTRADLRWANLSEADLPEADLTRANLSETDLYGANLTRADLRWANLTEANLTRADLRWANLRYANMSGADLTRADLRWACLYGATLPHRYIQIGPIGSRKDQIVYNADTDEIHAGCFRGSLDEFENVVREKHKTNIHAREYLATVRYLQEMREIQKTKQEDV